MNPNDLGLPPKFASWRPHQLDAVVAAACSDSRFTILNMPPGTGKTPMYMAVSHMVGGRMLVLTQTKGLQNQISTDFASMGLVEIKGQQNYPCRYFSDDFHVTKLPGCDEGPCHAGIQCILRDSGCHYYDALRTAEMSRWVVDNYAHWMSINRYADPACMGRFDTLVLDEAHDAAEALADFVKVTLVFKDVKKLIGVTMLRGATIDEWVEWAENAVRVCQDKLELAKVQTSLHRHGITAVRNLQILERNLSSLARARLWLRTDAPDPPAWVPGAATDWIIEEDKEGVSFQPTWATGYAEDYLFAKIRRVILVSATVTKKDAAYLGIPITQFSYHSYPSPFKKEVRPVYVIPTVRVGRNMMPGEERQWVNRIDQIIAKEKKHKGIIHTVSYARAKLIESWSRHANLFYTHNSSNTRRVVEAFKQAKPPAILVSPAVSTGWDFPGDECRFQIITKIPFIDNRPAVIQARARADRRYLDHVALVMLMQMTGRGVRAEDDWCRTYLIDDNWSWFYSRNKSMMAKWFKAAVHRVSSLSQVGESSWIGTQRTG